MGRSQKKWIFQTLQKFRYRHYLRLLDPKSKTLLDLGSMNDRFAKLAAEKGYSARATDVENDIHTTEDSADIVTCFQALEHTTDPVAAIKNLNKIYKRQLIISVPNEPWFSFWRLSWEKEHLWAITRAALHYHLGKPAKEKVIVLGRYYVGVWERN